MASRCARRLGIIQGVTDQQHFVRANAEVCAGMQERHRIRFLFGQAIARKDNIEIIQQAGGPEQGQGKSLSLVGDAGQPKSPLRAGCSILPLPLDRAVY